MNIVTTMTKIVIVISNASGERFGLLYEDAGVKNATSASNNIMQNYLYYH